MLTLFTTGIALDQFFHYKNLNEVKLWISSWGGLVGCSSFPINGLDSNDNYGKKRIAHYNYDGTKDGLSLILFALIVTSLAYI